MLIVSHGSPISACHFALSDGKLAYPGQCTISKYRIKNDTVSAGDTVVTDSNGKLWWRRGGGTPPMDKSIKMVKNEEKNGKKADETQKRKSADERRNELEVKIEQLCFEHISADYSIFRILLRMRSRGCAMPHAKKCPLCMWRSAAQWVMQRTCRSARDCTM